ERSSGRDRLLDRRDRVEGLEVELDQVARVLGHVATRGDDRGERLAVEASLVRCERAEDVLVRVRPEVRKLPEQLEGFLAGDDREGARQLPRLACVDRADVRVRD